jgi:hypothetical protein
MHHHAQDAVIMTWVDPTRNLHHVCGGAQKSSQVSCCHSCCSCRSVVT